MLSCCLLVFCAVALPEWAHPFRQPADFLCVNWRAPRKLQTLRLAPTLNHQTTIRTSRTTSPAKPWKLTSHSLVWIVSSTWPTLHTRRKLPRPSTSGWRGCNLQFGPSLKNMGRWWTAVVAPRLRRTYTQTHTTHTVNPKALFRATTLKNYLLFSCE